MPMTVDSRALLEGSPHDAWAPGSATGARRGEIFRALFDSLAPTDQEWVLERIRHYLALNAQEHIEARL
jgi:hypothetical protein